jgi:hypothetical protein
VLARAELQQLAVAGMTIGAHTLSHPILAQASGFCHFLRKRLLGGGELEAIARV